MNPIAIGSITFACVFAGALLGMFLREALPAHHLSPDAKDVVKLGMGLLGTTAALVLGLLIASAKSSFDTQNDEIKQAAANVLLLDHALAQYGSETKGIRDGIRRGVAVRLAVTWPEEGQARLETPDTTGAIEAIETRVRDLSPQNDSQRALQSRALGLLGDLQHTRWLLFGGAGDSLQTPFLVVLVLWITVIFMSFGLFAPRNATVVAVLVVCAFSIATSIFLIVEMDRPFGGMIRISSAPLRYTLAHLGQ